MRKMGLHIIAIIMLLTGCTNRDTIVDKEQILGSDFRVFQNTAAWELAKAVEDGDADKIKQEVSKNKSLLSCREPRLGQSVLHLAVYHTNYTSVKTLLELGADPNMCDLYYGDSPLTLAANITIPKADPRFLKLLLQYGGNPNAVQEGRETHGKNTALIIASQTGILDYVKMLVNAGPKVNTVTVYNEFALDAAATQQRPDVVMYLIEKGADFKKVLYQTIPEKENKYLTDNLRLWRFEIGSPEYKKKMQLVDFLKKNGMDYWKAPIPSWFYKDYPKEYLDKY